MLFTLIVVFVVIAALAVAARGSTWVKEKLASVWTAIAALAIAAGTWLASWWTSTPVDVPPM